MQFCKADGTVSVVDADFSAELLKGVFKGSGALLHEMEDGTKVYGYKQAKLDDKTAENKWAATRLGVKLRGPLLVVGVPSASAAAASRGAERAKGKRAEEEDAAGLVLGKRRRAADEDGEAGAEEPAPSKKRPAAKSSLEPSAGAGREEAVGSKGPRARRDSSPDTIYSGDEEVTATGSSLVGGAGGEGRRPMRKAAQRALPRMKEEIAARVARGEVDSDEDDSDFDGLEESEEEDDDDTDTTSDGASD